jgi:hypothetical protein
MKIANRFSWVLLAALFALVGCGKTEKAVDTSVDVLDASKFRPAFAAASAETKAIVDSVMVSIQDSDYKKAIAGCEKIAASPDLTEQQKKVVSDLSLQLNKKLAATTR